MPGSSLRTRTDIRDATAAKARDSALQVYLFVLVVFIWEFG